MSDSLAEVCERSWKIGLKRERGMAPLTFFRCKKLFNQPQLVLRYMESNVWPLLILLGHMYGWKTSFCSDVRVTHYAGPNLWPTLCGTKCMNHDKFGVKCMTYFCLYGQTYDPWTVIRIWQMSFKDKEMWTLCGLFCRWKVLVGK